MISKIIQNPVLVCTALLMTAISVVADESGDITYIKGIGSDFVDGNYLKHSDDLVEKTLDIHLDNGWVIRHVFKPKQIMSWDMIEGKDSDPSIPNRGTEAYRATSLREGFYLVDYIKMRQFVSLVLDFHRNIVTAVTIDLPPKIEYFKSSYQRVLNKEPINPISVHFLHGSINTPIQDRTPRHARTDDLVGKRIAHRYSPKAHYEHIYLNTRLYIWHCLEGLEKGLADTEVMEYFKLDKDLYLLVWIEKILLGAGLIMLDLEEGRTDGRFFGYAGNDFTETASSPMGAKITLLNDLKYD